MQLLVTFIAIVTIKDFLETKCVWIFKFVNSKLLGGRYVIFVSNGIFKIFKIMEIFAENNFYMITLFWD